MAVARLDGAVTFVCVSVAAVLDKQLEQLPMRRPCITLSSVARMWPCKSYFVILCVVAANLRSGLVVDKCSIVFIFLSNTVYSRHTSL
jgi:hypothetical protein